MANVTFGRNTPTPYDIRMEGMRARPSAPSSVNPASRSTQTPVGQVGGLMQTLANTSLLAPLLYNAGAAWKGFSKTPQGQLLTDRVGETLSAPGRLLNSALGGNNPLPSFGGNAPRLTQFTPPGFNPNKPVTGADLAQSAQAVSRYSPGPSSFQGGNGGGSAAAERAYQAERSSTAQQAAQNPELQRYQDQAALARQSLQGYNPASGPLPGAAQTAQDMGMAMWAKANPGLAANVRPGQSGFGAIQNTLAGSAANTGFQSPSQLLTTPPPPVTPTPFPTSIPQSGFQVPGAPTADQLSSYPQFDPNKVDIGLFSKFMQANPKK